MLAIWTRIVENWQVQARSESNPELLDAAALCRRLVPEGSVEAFLADHRHELFPDEMFEDLFPSGRGRPSIPADVVASVMVLQALEGLSDRDAARALRDRISWKVACGLALDNEGFDFSVLTYWRTRLRKSDKPERIFDAVRCVIDATGVLKGKTRRALDSTLLDEAVATGCALRDRCTTSQRGLKTIIHPHDDELVAARLQWKEGVGLEEYRRWRPMVERSIAWLVTHGNRRVRFRGVERNQLGLSNRVAALNLRRLVNLGLDHDGGWRIGLA